LPALLGELLIAPGLDRVGTFHTHRLVAIVCVAFACALIAQYVKTRLARGHSLRTLGLRLGLATPSRGSIVAASRDGIEGLLDFIGLRFSVVKVALALPWIASALAAAATYAVAISAWTEQLIGTNRVVGVPTHWLAPSLLAIGALVIWRLGLKALNEHYDRRVNLRVNEYILERIMDRYAFGEADASDVELLAQLDPDWAEWRLRDLLSKKPNVHL